MKERPSSPQDLAEFLLLDPQRALELTSRALAYTQPASTLFRLRGAILTVPRLRAQREWGRRGV